VGKYKDKYPITIYERWRVSRPLDKGKSKELCVMCFRGDALAAGRKATKIYGAPLYVTPIGKPQLKVKQK